MLRIVTVVVMVVSISGCVNSSPNESEVELKPGEEWQYGYQEADSMRLVILKEMRHEKHGSIVFLFFDHVRGPGPDGEPKIFAFRKQMVRNTIKKRVGQRPTPSFKDVYSKWESKIEAGEERVYGKPGESVSRVLDWQVSRKWKHIDGETFFDLRSRDTAKENELDRSPGTYEYSSPKDGFRVIGPIERLGSQLVLGWTDPANGRERYEYFDYAVDGDRLTLEPSYEGSAAARMRLIGGEFVPIDD